MADKTSSIPTDLHDLLEKLLFLSMLENGNKINTTNRSFDNKDSWLANMWRMFQHENRDKTIIFLNSVNAQLNVLLDKYRHNAALMKIVIPTLVNANLAIGKLAETYNQSPSFVAQLQVILTNIGIHINNFREFATPD